MNFKVQWWKFSAFSLSQLHVAAMIRWKHPFLSSPQPGVDVSVWVCEQVLLQVGYGQWESPAWLVAGEKACRCDHPLNDWKRFKVAEHVAEPINRNYVTTADGRACSPSAASESLGVLSFSIYIRILTEYAAGLKIWHRYKISQSFQKTILGPMNTSWRDLISLLWIWDFILPIIF